MNLCNHPDAVQWNPQNKVVQCHVCGQVWVPLAAEEGEPYQLMVMAEEARLHDAVLGTECKEWLHPATYRKSAAELMKAAGVPNMLEGRKLNLDPCHRCMHGNCHICEHGGP